MAIKFPFTVRTSRGPVRFVSVGEPIVEVKAAPGNGSLVVRESGIVERCCDEACARSRAEVAEWDRPHTDAALCALCGGPIGG